MNTLNKLIDSARKECGRDSDRAVAERLKVSGNTMMQWRRGTVRITDEHLIALIELAKADESTLLKVRQEMAGSPAQKKHWSSLLDRMGAAVVAVAVGVIALAHPVAHEAWQAAAALPLLAVTPSFYTLCEIQSGQNRDPASLDLAMDQDLPSVSDPHRYGDRRVTDTYDLDRRPPCWAPGTPCPNHCARDVHRRVIDNHVELAGPRAGWRLAGRDLVAPSGERIPERRLRGLLWRTEAADLRDAARARNAARKARQQAMVKVVVVDIGDWRERHFGRAG